MSGQTSTNSSETPSSLDVPGREIMAKQLPNSRTNPLANQLGNRMYAKKDETGDIKFKVDGVEISAHKIVLATLSPKYEAQFYGDFDDKTCESIEVKEVSAAAFKQFLQFFYCDQVVLTHENIEDVITLAKAALVDEFFTACIGFLTETLSIENVCQTYYLAVLHECDQLIDSCECMISLNSDEVFASKGFIACNRVSVFNILQMDTLKSKEMDVFKAAIAWAKNYCAANGWDPSKDESLRRALADSLYQIRFGTMAIEDFMYCFKTHKDIFTENEREEILYVIGKICDSGAKKFNDDPRDVILYRKWDKELCINCDRVAAELTSITFHFGVCKTLFTCSHPILLGAFEFGRLAESLGSISEKSTSITVRISRKRFVDHKTLFEGVGDIVFKATEPTIFHLPRPVLIKPNFSHEIQVAFKSGLSLKDYTFKKQVSLDQTIVEFHETKSPITKLLVNICEEVILVKDEPVDVDGQ